MKEQAFLSKQQTTDAIVQYYEHGESGYWGYLKGRCHYGYSNEQEEHPFNMESAQLEMERKLAHTLNLPKGSTVLDAGCGYGPVARTLTQEFGFHVTGIDLIHDRLVKSNTINVSGGHHIDSINADYQYLPFADQTFDGVYTMETLVHAHDYHQVLREFFRVLKPGGRLVLFEYSIPNLQTVPKPLRSLAERVIHNTGMASLPDFTHGSFPGILQEAGFTNALSEDVSKHVYASWFYLWKFALHFTLQEARHGRIGLDTIPGSMWIWPTRSRLGYNICQATKPTHKS